MGIKYQICNRCVMDTTDKDIVFDENGICNHCKRAVSILNSEPFCLSPSGKEKLLDELVHEIKIKGAGKPYDCIIGLSGGVDSTYTAYKVKKLGLRPLAVHLDNGWNSELSVINIENICKKLEIDLYTCVMDWEEFKDLQLSFLKASTPDSEIITDNLIFAALWRIAQKKGIGYILAGYNFSSESIMVANWSQGYYDKKYIKTVHKKFGSNKLKNVRIISQYEISLIRKIRKIKLISFLDYLEYNKNEAKELIMTELDWRDYGRKHCESNYTRIYQEYIMPSKFGIDKRRAHLSSLIMAEQISRDEALMELVEPLYTSQAKLKEDIAYLTNKFGISENEFKEIMELPIKSYNDYSNMQNIWYLSLPMKIYLKLRRCFAN